MSSPSPAAAPVLSEARTAVPEPLVVPTAADAPAAGPGFTIEISTMWMLPTGAQGPSSVAALEVGISNRYGETGEALMPLKTAPDGKAQVAFPRSRVPEATPGQQQWLWLRSAGAGLLTRTAWERLPGADGAYLGEAVMTRPDSSPPELAARLIENFLDAP